jgi:hypothetical protein
MFVIGEAAWKEGMGLYGKFLYAPLNFSVTLNCSKKKKKKKVCLKKERKGDNEYFSNNNLITSVRQGKIIQGESVNQGFNLIN